ncbi:MAG: hypothetical protein ACLP5E_09285 [Streptosporangiaceae bacterium]
MTSSTSKAAGVLSALPFAWYSATSSSPVGQAMHRPTLPPRLDLPAQE